MLTKRLLVGIPAGLLVVAAVLPLSAAPAPAQLSPSGMGSTSSVDPRPATRVAIGSAEAPGSATMAEVAPNIVVIVADDQRDGTVSGMPFTRRQLVEKGVNFKNAQSVTSTCCPARATMLTGNLAPRTGVWTNWAPDGGWEAFRRLEDRTLPVALEAAGYATGLVGKYLNGYADPRIRVKVEKSGDYIPPGWDTWHAFGVPASVKDPDVLRASDQGYYDYWLMNWHEGESRPSYREYGSQSTDYSTDVLGSLATQFIRDTPSAKPLFLWYSPLSPHAPYTPAKRHARAVVEVPAVPGFGDASGKPSWISALPGVAANKAERLATRQMRALLSLDDNVKGIVEALADSGRLSNTLIVYVSDNSLTWGEFNLLGNKNYPYTTDVPLMMRWDDAPSGSALARTGPDHRLVSLADVAATIAGAAGVAMPDMVDGIDLATQEYRDSLLIAAWRNRGARSPMPSYCGVRTRDWLYVRYRPGVEEAYRVSEDPAFLDNLMAPGADPGLPSDVLDRLRTRTREACDPSPPGYLWE